MTMQEARCPDCRKVLLVDTPNSGPYGGTEWELHCPDHGQIWATDWQFYLNARYKIVDGKAQR